ncbi:MFS transporter [Cystobacter fuscus]
MTGIRVAQPPPGRLRRTFMDSASPSLRSVLALLRRNADYRRLFLATVVSMLGDWFAFVAISGFVTETTGHLSASAAVYAASVLPASLLSPFAGLLADRMDRQRLMVTVDLVRVLPALGMLAALLWRAPLLALVCVALLAALSAFFDPVAEPPSPTSSPPRNSPSPRPRSAASGAACSSSAPRSVASPRSPSAAT